MKPNLHSTKIQILQYELAVIRALALYKFLTVKSNLMRQMSVATGQMVYLQGLVKVVTED